MPGRTEEIRGKIRFGAPIIATKAYKDTAVGGGQSSVVVYWDRSKGR